MTASLLKGVLLGLTVAIIVGPVFFTLLQTSINRGLKAGVQLAVGVVLSDLVLIVLSYVGILQLINNSHNYIIIGIAGGILLVVIGLYTATRKAPIAQQHGAPKLKIRKISASTFVLKGFFMNIINPFLLIFWITVMSYHGVQESTKVEITLFFSTALVTIFITDVIKCYVAKKIKRFITQNVLLWVNRIVGIVLVFFGVLLIFRVFFLSEAL